MELKLVKTFRLNGRTYYGFGICKNCNRKFPKLRKESIFCCISCYNIYTKTGKHHTEETKQKLSIAGKNRILTEEHKRKIGESHKGEKHYNWKGGVKKLNIPLYDTYAHQLEPIEQCRCTEEGYLEVKCAYCGHWFVPKTNTILYRIQIINGAGNGGESRFYCSTSCKSNCPIYNQKKFSKGYKPATSREVQPELRQLVFERDNWTCIKCGSTSNLHCHHIEGLKHNPLMSADMDICITLCKSCHKNVHKQKDCRYIDMRCING